MKRLVHNRDYSVQTYELGDQRILVEGTLTDHRYQKGDSEEPDEPRLIHDMIVRLWVKGPEMLIEKAEAEMPCHPREECTEVLPWIRDLEGMTISTGFTMRAKETIGEVKGCAHITGLVVAMAPAAVQGYFSAYGGTRQKRGPNEDALKKVVNTCYLWREDGPLIKSIRGARNI